MTCKNSILLLLIIAQQSCLSQNSNDKKIVGFEWIDIQEPQFEYQYNLALTHEDKIYALAGNREGTMEVLENDTWSTLPSLPNPRIFSGGVILGDSIYVIGGMDNKAKYSNSVDIYNIKNKKWSKSSNLPTAKCRLSCVASGGKIYAIGGLEGTDDSNFKNSNTIEVYDPKTKSWTILTYLSPPRHGHSAIAYGNKLLVVGGYSDSGPMALVQEYDIASQSWLKKTDMPTPRGFFGLVQIDQKIYAIGGRVPDNRGPIAVFDISNNSWQKLNPLIHKRNRFGITSMEDNIYIVGGEKNPKSVLVGTFIYK